MRDIMIIVGDPMPLIAERLAELTVDHPLVVVANPTFRYRDSDRFVSLDPELLTIKINEPIACEPAPGMGKRHHRRAEAPETIDPSLSRQQRRLYDRRKAR